MKLDKSHLNQFENISPPMVNALTIPVDNGVVIYVCALPFSLTLTTKADVLAVAKALTVKE